MHGENSLSWPPDADVVLLTVSGVGCRQGFGFSIGRYRVSVGWHEVFVCMGWRKGNEFWSPGCSGVGIGCLGGWRIFCNIILGGGAVGVPWAQGLVILVCVYFGALKLFECRMLSIYEFVLRFRSERFRNVSAHVASLNFLGVKWKLIWSSPTVLVFNQVPVVFLHLIFGLGISQRVLLHDPGYL